MFSACVASAGGMIAGATVNVTGTVFPVPPATGATTIWPW
jgi:hypothetical protein